MSIAKNKTRLSIVVDKDVKDKLEQLAKEEKRSTGNLVSIILENYVNQYFPKSLK